MLVGAVSLGELWEMIDWDILKPLLEQLKDYALASSQEEIRDLLIKIVPDFNPQSKVIDLMHDK